MHISKQIYSITLQIMEEFKKITNQVESPEDTINVNWHKWQPKVFPYTELSNKACIKDLVQQKQRDIPNGKNNFSLPYCY